MNHLCSSRIDNGTLVTLVCGDESTGNTTIVLIHLFKMALTKVIFKLFLAFSGLCMSQSRLASFSQVLQLHLVSMTVSYAIAGCKFAIIHLNYFHVCFIEILSIRILVF